MKSVFNDRYIKVLNFCYFNWSRHKYFDIYEEYF
jgi:hypothetical protein